MSDTTQPPPKRKRVTKACLVCAKSRRKCDGIQPTCGTCRSQGSTCAWSDVPTRRGPPKGYRNGAADPKSLLPKLGKIREHVKALQVAYGEKIVMDELELCLFGSILHGRAGSVETVRDGDDSSQDGGDDHASSEVDEGSSSGLAFLATSVRYLTTSDSRGDSLSPTDRSFKYNPWAVADQAQQSGRRRRDVRNNSYLPEPNPAEIELLLKTYWSSIHPHWPILYKPAFDSISIFRISHEVPRSLLYSIFALSSRLTPASSLNAELSETFVHIAEEEVLQGALRSTLDTCTALFLLSLHYHGEGNQRQAWVLCGLASMMALDLGLHKRTSKMPLDEHERRVRVFWNIFVYEKVLAAEMGRPITIRMAHCDTTRLSEEQPDEYETIVHPVSGLAVRLHTLSIFNAAVDLFRIFERILSEVHTVPSMASTRSARERLVHELDRELMAWQSSLPSRCAFPHPDDKIPTRTLYLTHAWYLVAIILLHRPLIPRFRPGHAFTGNIHHTKATNAANRLVDLLSQYAIGQDIDKLPPNDAYLIFTSAILHIFNLGLENRAMRDAARPRLEQCLEWLRGLAETWPAASSHKRLLDAFSKAATNTISRTLTPLEPHPSDPHYPNMPFSLTSVLDHTQQQQQQQQQHASAVGAPLNHSGNGVSSLMAPTDVSHHGHGHVLQLDAEQKFSTPELFSLENLYWNDFQTVNMGQLGEIFGQTGGEFAPSHGSVYHDVLRNLEDGRAV